MPSIEFSDVVKSYATDGEALGVDGDDVDGIAVATAVELAAHVDDTGNPHDVTKDQVGLGNVDNTSDLDKPISTATQSALDGKLAPSDLPGGDPAELLTTADINGSVASQSAVEAAQSQADKAAWTVRDVVGDLLNGWTATFVRLAYNDRLCVLSVNGLNPASATSDTLLNFSSELRSFTTLRGFLGTATAATNTPTMRGVQIHTGGDVRAPRGGGSAMFGTIWWVTSSAGVPASPPGVPG